MEQLVPFIMVAAKHLIYDDTRPRKAEDITEENYREQNSVVNHFLKNYSFKRFYEY